MIDESLAAFLETKGDANDESLPDAGVTYPALVYSLVSEVSEPALDYSQVIEVESLFNVVIWAETKLEARSIARSIVTSFNGFVGDFYGTDVSNMLVSIAHEGEEKDSQIRLKSVALEIRIFQS